VPGGHLGMLTGRAARRTTWVVMDEWIAQHSTAERQQPAPAAPRRQAAKKATAKRTKPSTRTTKKAAPPAAAKTAKTPKTAKSTSRRKAASPDPAPTEELPGSPSASTDVAPDRGAIGSNPERRFGSEASRGLAPKR